MIPAFRHSISRYLVFVLVIVLSACASSQADNEAASSAGNINLPMVLASAPSASPSVATPAILSPQPSPTVIAHPVPTPAELPVYTYTVVNTYPHDPQAFTQGLVYYQGVLYEGTGLYGHSTLRRVDLTTGTVLQEHALDAEYFGEGITLFGDTLIQLTWQSNIGFVYDRETFAQLRDFAYPTEGWGLTHDGTRLIMSDGTATLFLLDPVTLERVGQVDVFDANGAVTRLNELEYVNGEVFANIWQNDRVARIDPLTGQVAGWVNLSGLLSAADRQQSVDVLNGIAYDAATDRLFVTGKFWPKLFEIDLVAPDDAR